MPRNNAGVYLQPASNVNPPISGTVIDPAAFAAALTDISNELTNSLDRLGRSPMLTTLPMGGFRIVNVGAAIAGTDVASLADVKSFVPTGAIMDFAMSVPPAGWLVCDGAAVSRVTYAPLFSSISTVWGIGDGATTFNLPDFRGTSRRGWDNGRGFDPARAFASYQADKFASHTHVQTAHTHTITDPGHTHTVTSVNGAVGAAGGAVNAGGATATTSSVATGVTAVTTTAVNAVTGGTETVGKNYAILVCIRT